MSNSFIVDDQDASIVYTGHWNLGGDQADFSQTASSSSSSGATMSFSFSGNYVTAIGDFQAGGTCNGSFSIDGAVSNFTSPAQTTSLYQQTLWASPTLSEGNHTLIYTVSSCNSSQSFVSLDYLLYNSSELITGTTSFFDDRDSRLVYSGSTNSTSGENDFQGTITGLQQGADFQFQFNGTSVQVYGRVDNETVGIVTDASFSIDGSPSVSFTAVTSSTVIHNKQFYASRPLNSGQHTLTVSNSGDSPVWVDYILVRGATTAASEVPSTNSSSLSHHRLLVIIGLVVGSVVGISLLIAMMIYLYRRSAFKRPKRPKNGREGSPPDPATDFDDTAVPHRPRFIPQGSIFSLSKTADSSELYPLAHKRLPFSQTSSTYDSSTFSESEVGYHDESFVGHSPQPGPSREGSYMSIPHSTQPGHRSYGSESSLLRSAVPSQDMSHTIDTQGPTARAPESVTTGGTGPGYGRSPRRRSTINVSGDHLSAADLKRQQSHLYILSVEGMTSEPVVHTDSGIRLRPNMGAHAGGGIHLPLTQDPELETELPPLYSAE